MKTVLVTGGAGFIGSHLCEALLGKGCRVVVLDNLSTGRLSNIDAILPRITFIKGDIRDTDRLAEAVKGCDTVFHLAAMVSVPESVSNPVQSAMINEMGTLLVLEAARTHNVRGVVFSSSCAVYGGNPALPLKESATLYPMSPYALQKRTAEAYAALYLRLYGLKTVCLRYFNVYGPRQDPSSDYSGVISIFMTRALSNESATIYGDGRQFRDFVFVGDVVKANLLAAGADAAIGRIINIGTGNAVKIGDLWDAICRICHIQTTPQYAPERSGDVRKSLADITLAKELLGFMPQTAFETGLQKTIAWFRDNKNT